MSRSFKIKPTSRAVARNMKADSRRRVHLTPAQQALMDAFKARRTQTPGHLPFAAPAPASHAADPFTPMAAHPEPKADAGWRAAWETKRAYKLVLTGTDGQRRDITVSFKKPRTHDIVLTSDTFDQLDARAAW